MEVCGGRCLSCGAHEELTVDHIRPLGRGGSNAIENIQPLCAACNNAKGHRVMDYRSAEVQTGQESGEVGPPRGIMFREGRGLRRGL